MLPRDNLGYDYIHNYYPKIDANHFKRDMFSSEKGKKWIAALSPEDQENYLRLEKRIALIKVGTPLVSILGAALLHKVPGVKELENKWLISLGRVGAFVLPIVAGARLCERQRESFHARLFAKNKAYYKLFKYTGDIKSMNPNVKLVPRQ